MYLIGWVTVELVRGDITEERVDAIVNAANSTLLGGGGVDGAIHRAAGPELLRACREAKRTLPAGELPTGQAVITPGFALPARHVIHTVGPIYRRDGAQAPALLASCYRASLRLARQLQLRSIAFPSISTGAFGYPVAEAAEVVCGLLDEELWASEMPERVRLVFFDDASLEIHRRAADARWGR